MPAAATLAAPWTRPADVRAAVRKKWDSGTLLTRFAAGQAWEPLSLPIRGPSARQIGDRLAEVRRWVAEWAQAERGPLRVEYKQVGGRHFGTNSIPCRAWLDGYDQAWTLLAVAADVRRLTGLIEAARGTRLIPWLAAHPMRALRLAGAWDKLLATVRWIEERQAPGMYLRQIDVPGVDTKFIERHKGVLTELLDAQLDPSRVQRAASDFPQRYGFLRRPGYARFRVAGGFRGFSELSVRTNEFTAAPAGITRAYVIENEITYLAFPLPAAAIAILGGGYAVPVLEPLGWLAGLDVVYWGDIDTHGFAILDRLRRHLPHARSMLMDRATLLAHREHWGTEPSPTTADLDRLDAAESALYADLISNAYAPSVRLEQERISFAAVETAARARSGLSGWRPPAWVGPVGEGTLDLRGHIVADRLFRDRRDAGRFLAGLLEEYRGRDDVIVLGLPRGGVPVAYEVAATLGAPLDVFLVRKLGLPGREELAMGAIASGGVTVLCDDVVRGMGIASEAIQRVAQQEGRELLRREQAYREGRPLPEVAGQVVIVVDDGLATGSSMRAAIEALRKLRPARIVVAVPAAPQSTCRELAALADEVVCATTPAPFSAVGSSYWDFAQTSDEEVQDLLRAAGGPRQPAASAPGPTDVALIRAAGLPAQDGIPTDAELFDLVGDAHLVLIGAESHGTAEFYAARATMTCRLIEERQFCAVAAEADWPDAYRVNRYVRGQGSDVTAEEALHGFDRFPAWMWRNAEMLEFAGRLREHNDRAGRDERVKAGFYGLDLYSLFRSAQEVISYLERVDPAAAARARERYACFDHLSEDDAQVYGFAAAFGAGEPCEQEVVQQLADLRRHALDYARRDCLTAQDDLFYAKQNARTVRAAEEYYRAMFSGRLSTWNLRDRHMADSLDALAGHLGRQLGAPPKIVVWAHNSHVGDARATETATRGEVNLGQLVRERHAGDCRLVGFTTYTGTVTAASDWEGPAERMLVRPALPDSIEELFHEVGQKDFLLRLDAGSAACEALRSARLQRAIGVIYRPETERRSHYLRARVADQYDAVIHLDETRAAEPLERTAPWERGEFPETYPFAV